MEPLSEAGDRPTKTITVEISAEQLEKHLPGVLKKLNAQTSLKGFRPGRAPDHILLRKYPGPIFNELYDLLIRQAVVEAVEANGLEAAGRPRIEEIPDIKKGEPLLLPFVFDLPPQLPLPDFSELRLVLANIEITDAEVEGQIDSLRHQFGTMTQAGPDYEASVGDKVTVVLSTPRDGEFVALSQYDRLEGGSNPPSKMVERNPDSVFDLVIAPDQPLQDVVEALLGQKVGQCVDVPVVFPAIGYPSFDNREIILRAQVLSISQVTIPEANDDFVKDLGQKGLSTIEDLRKRVRDDFKVHCQQLNENLLETQIVPWIDERVALPWVPWDLLREELDNLIEIEWREKNPGVDVKSRKNEVKRYLEDPKRRERFLPKAMIKAKYKIIFNQIATSEGLTLAEDEVQLNVAELVAQHSGGKPDIQTREAYREIVRDHLRRRKVLEWIASQARVDLLPYERANAVFRAIMSKDKPPKPPEAPETAEAAREVEVAIVADSAELGLDHEPLVIIPQEGLSGQAPEASAAEGAKAEDGDEEAEARARQALEAEREALRAQRNAAEAGGEQAAESGGEPAAEAETAKDPEAAE
jgi:trigger factor